MPNPILTASYLYTSTPPWQDFIVRYLSIGWLNLSVPKSDASQTPTYQQFTPYKVDGTVGTNHGLSMRLSQFFTDPFPTDAPWPLANPNDIPDLGLFDGDQYCEATAIGQIQSVPFSDAGGIFGATDPSTVIRWMQIRKASVKSQFWANFGAYPPGTLPNGVTTTKGGPIFMITGNYYEDDGDGNKVAVEVASDSIPWGADFTGISLGIKSASFSPAYVTPKWSGNRIPNDAPAEEGWYQFTTVNPSSGIFWTVGDLIGSPASEFLIRLNSLQDPLVPSNFFDTFRINSAFLDLGHEVWFLPTISAISPVSCGPLAGGTSITITGTNFFNDGNNVEVFVGGTLATNIVWVNDHTITIVTPAHSAAVVDIVVRVHYPDGSTEDATFPASFTFPCPSVGNFCAVGASQPTQDTICALTGSLGASQPDQDAICPTCE